MTTRSGCCPSHTSTCEYPAELCCSDCTEVHHTGLLGQHDDGSDCVLPYPAWMPDPRAFNASVHQLADAMGVTQDEAQRAAASAVQQFDLAKFGPDEVLRGTLMHVAAQHGKTTAMRQAIEWEQAAAQVAALTGRPLDAARRALAEFAKTAGATPASAVAETQRMLEHSREAHRAAALNAQAAARQIAAARAVIPASTPHVPKVTQRRAKRKQAKASRKANRR